MHEIKPLSLKLRIAVRQEIRSIAEPMGYTEHGFIVESVKAILHMVQTRDKSVPLMVIMAWSVRDYTRNPSQLCTPASSIESVRTTNILPSNPPPERKSVENTKKQGVQVRHIVRTLEISKAKNRKCIPK